jgi:hypothetical protein
MFPWGGAPVEVKCCVFCEKEKPDQVKIKT